MHTTAPIRDMQLGDDAYGRTATLIHCNREQPSMCARLRKHIIKTESKDSGGSFDSFDSDEYLGGVFVDSATGMQTNTLLGPRIVPDTQSADSDDVAARTADCVTGSRTSYVVHPHNGQCELTHGDCKTGSRTSYMVHPHNGQCELTHGDCKGTNTNATRFCAESISPVFSWLAKDLRSRRAHLVHQHVLIDDDVPGMCLEADDACAGHTKGGTVNISSEESVLAPLCADYQTEDDVMVAGCQQYRHHSLESESNGVARRFSRSISDSGRSTLSNELSDCEKTSLSCSRSSRDIWRSSLSLDMGISVSSIESLEERSLTESGDSPRGASRVVDEDALQATCGDICPCCRSHERVSTPVQHVLDARETRSRSSGSSGDSEIGNLNDLTELPVRNRAPSSLNGTCNKTSCMAASSSTATRTVIRTRRKRDFHSWENHLINAAGCDPSMHELAQLLDFPAQHDRSSIDSSSNPDVSCEVSKHSPVDVSLEAQTACLISEQDTDHADPPQTQYESLSQLTTLVSPANNIGRPTTPTPRIEVCSSSRHSPSIDGRISTYSSTASSSVDRSALASYVYNKASPRETAAYVTANPSSQSSSDLAESTANGRTIGGRFPEQYGLSQFDQIGTTPQKSYVRTIPQKSCADMIPQRSCTNVIPQRPCVDMIPQKSCTDMIPQRSCSNVIPQKPCADTSCLKSVGTVFRRISSPGKNVAALLGTGRYKYDVQDAALGYLSLGYLSPAKSCRQRTLMQKFTSTKSSSFDEASLDVSTCHMKNSPSSPLLLSSSSSSPSLSQRFRSFSVGACSAPARRVTDTRGKEVPGEKEILGSGGILSDNALSRQPDDDDDDGGGGDEDLLAQNW